MNIFVLNGSPKAAGSSTLTVTNAFLEGVREMEKNCSVDVLNIQEAKIEHCTGCATCWRTTPGECVIKDDMAGIKAKYLAADIVIWSFPLYIYGAPSKTKACMDRLIFPLLLPQIYLDKDGVSRHPWRYDMRRQRQVLISCCGFPTVKGNFDALLLQMDIINRNITNILCSGSFSLRNEACKEQAARYLACAKQAGKEYIFNGELSQETVRQLEIPMVQPEEFIKNFNARWD